MGRYYEAMDQAWRSVPQPLTYVNNPAGAFLRVSLSHAGCCKWPIAASEKLGRHWLR